MWYNKRRTFKNDNTKLTPYSIHMEDKGTQVNIEEHSMEATTPNVEDLALTLKEENEETSFMYPKLKLFTKS